MHVLEGILLKGNVGVTYCFIEIFKRILIAGCNAMHAIDECSRFVINFNYNKAMAVYNDQHCLLSGLFCIVINYFLEIYTYIKHQNSY